ncbi:MAG: transglutaminase-like domain-containing protein [Lachnospiraceae bacterium]|jgi:hypothetical protein|nr:transglutaminase-like domain-containing protein [Lachnospiraceae bacterium]
MHIKDRSRTFGVLAALLSAMVMAAGVPVNAASASQGTPIIGLTPGAGFEEESGGIGWKLADGSSAKDSWLSFGGHEYYIDPDGYIRTGTYTLDHETYQFLAEGRAVPVGTDSTQPVTEDRDRAALRQKCDRIIASVTTPDMSKEQKLRAVYDWEMKACGYKRNSQIPSGDFTPSYALQILTSGRGNCFRFSSAFAYLAKDLGFESVMITGKCDSLSRRGTVAPHGWPMVYDTDGWYIFDPDMEDGTSNGHASFWKRTYDNYPLRKLYPEKRYEIYF